MCPDTTLLAASVDGTLFPADARVVDQHVAACRRCAEVVSRFRRERHAENAQRISQESRTRSRRTAVVGMLIVAGLGGSLTVSGLGRASGRNTDQRNTPAAPKQFAPTVTAPPTPALLATRASELRFAMKAAPKRIVSPANAHVEASSPEHVVKTADSGRVHDAPAAAAIAPRESQQPSARAHVEAARPASESALTSTGEPAEAETLSPAGLVLRGKDRKSAWRARGGVVEHSADGGTTWAEEYRVEHAVVAGSYVTPDVAWLAAADGVILRRTTVGWFETSARADGAVTSIRASSPTKASITLADGRTFETKNAGVEWTEAPAPASVQKTEDRPARSGAKKNAPAARHHSKRSRR